jgi:hypothetical protein
LSGRWDNAVSSLSNKVLMVITISKKLIVKERLFWRLSALVLS